MDIIKFNDLTDGALSLGEIVSGMTSIMWIERYREASEFTIVGPVGSDLRNTLPVGTFITHMDSDIPMIVENHAITVNDENEANITVTGRSVETVYENRIVGATGNWADVARYNNALDVSLLTDYTWVQAKRLLDKTVYSGPGSGDPYDDFYGMGTMIQDGIYDIAVALGSPEALLRTAEFGTFYEALMKLLAIDNLGIKATWRPWDMPGFGLATNMMLIIHKGIDLSGEVIFSDILGDIESAEYLWSLKSYFSAALAKGKWVSYPYKGTERNWDRRYKIVNAEDIDGGYEVAPFGTDLDDVTVAMYNRAWDAVASSRATALAQANSRKGTTRYHYRKDYNVGDIVGILGDYDEARNMQVVEYVEIDDDTGESGYPTFAPI